MENNLNDSDGLSKLSKKYELSHKLGAGAQGTVFKAKVIASGKFVAIKHVKVRTSQPYMIKKLVREIQILKELSQDPGSKFITRLLEVISDPINSSSQQLQVFLVLEYVEGMDFKDFLDKAQKKAISVHSKDCRLLIYNLLTALNFVHNAGVIHRDIKPSNILI